MSTVQRAPHPDADLDYVVVQVTVDRTVIERVTETGSLSAEQYAEWITIEGAAERYAFINECADLTETEQSTRVILSNDRFHFDPMLEQYNDGTIVEVEAR